MRKLVVTEFVSLDGVVEAPEKWHASYTGEDSLEAAGKRYFASDALLLGRETYHSFVGIWPFKTADDSTFADHMNAGMRKYVVSSTLDEVGWGKWGNATLIKGDVAEGVSRLKQEPGKDILVAGSISLVRALGREDLSTSFTSWSTPSSRAGGASSRTGEIRSNLYWSIRRLSARAFWTLLTGGRGARRRVDCAAARASWECRKNDFGGSL